jgi:hypothetical protein
MLHSKRLVGGTLKARPRAYQPGRGGSGRVVDGVAADPEPTANLGVAQTLASQPKDFDLTGGRRADHRRRRWIAFCFVNSSFRDLDTLMSL